MGLEEKQQIRKKYLFLLFSSFLYILLGLLAGCFSAYYKLGVIQGVKWGITGWIFLSVLLFLVSSDYFSRFGLGISLNAWKVGMVLGAVLVSCVLVFLSGQYAFGQLWFFAAVTASVMLGSVFGFGLHMVFCILYCGLNQLSVADFVFYFLLGSFFCIFARYFGQAVNLVYVSFILVAMEISLLFIWNDFMFVEKEKLLFSIITTLVMILAEFLVFCFWGKHFGSPYTEQENTGELNHILAASQEEKEEIGTGSQGLGFIGEGERKQTGIHKTEEGWIPVEKTEDMPGEYGKDQLSVFESEEYELRKRLKRASLPLYIHCQMVGDTAAEAAEIVGADVQLARIGGYYHEIGRLKTDGIKRSYIDNGIIHLEEHGFPEEVISIVRQHSYKNEKPSTREAALVMLSDSIFSTIEYLKKNGPYDEKRKQEVIENILKLRMKNGSLDESGFFIRDYNLLCPFFREIAFDNMEE